jgi:hypothetical protein
MKEGNALSVEGTSFLNLILVCLTASAAVAQQPSRLLSWSTLKRQEMKLKTSDAAQVEIGK